MGYTLEYRTVDKSAWPRGPWDDEPDKVQWQDEVTGLLCLIHRGPSGALCGYVGVSPGHPLHGVGTEDALDRGLSVHGGITYAAGCQHGPDPSTGICHIPEPGETDDVWWIGFDCAHAFDMSGMAWRTSRPEPSSLRPGFDEIYRDIAYVRRECAHLAGQLAAAA